MDPLSDIVALLRPHDCVAAGLDAGGDWSVRFDRHAGLKCNAVLEGACWLRIEGMDAPLRLEAGDCAILPHGRPFVLSARPMRDGADAATVYAPVPHGGTTIHGGGGDFFMTGARFLLSGPAAAALLRALPPALVVRPGAAGNTVRWSLARIAEGVARRPPGPRALGGAPVALRARAGAALPSGRGDARRRVARAAGRPAARAGGGGDVRRSRPAVARGRARGGGGAVAHGLRRPVQARVWQDADGLPHHAADAARGRGGCGGAPPRWPRSRRRPATRPRAPSRPRSGGPWGTRRADMRRAPPAPF